MADAPAGIGGPAADPGAIGGPVGSPSGAPPSDGSDGSRSGARTAERSRVHSVFGAGEVAPSTVLYRAGDKVRPTVKDLLNKKSSFYKEASPHKKPRPGLGPIPDIAEEVGSSGSGQVGANGGAKGELTAEDAAKVAAAVAAGDLSEVVALDDDPDDPMVDVEEPAAKLGWVSGVMVPVLLNIWGVIMFLRLGWVAGQAGLGLATLIIVASNVVTLITTLSLCAICTNGLVKGGGAYYLISRALGPAFGGAIGLLFYVAQAIATSMYVVGFAESVIDLLKTPDAEPFTGDWGWDQRVIGLVTCTFLLGVALTGVSWYAKSQIGLLFILVVAMVSVIAGAFAPAVPDAALNAAAGFVGLDSRNLDAEFVADTSTLSMEGFFSVFSVFFPAVTGIMAGANMSGDLADPSDAIPRGTLSGIAITFVSYVGLLWIIGSSCERCVGEACSASDYGTEAWAARVDSGELEAPTGGLVYNKLIMQNLSLWGPLVYAGVFSATLSSALASLVGAPRILQAVARDNLFPILFPFSQDDKLDEPKDVEPVRGYFLTYVIAMACVLIGELNLIAPLISNFFMISYALTNFACFWASTSKVPGWRPTFPYYNPYLSMFGAFLCIVIMFAFDLLASLISVFIGFAIYAYLISASPAVADWGPAGDARKYITAVKRMSDLLDVTTADGTQHVKSFRPSYLVLTGDPGMRPHLVKFAMRLYKGRGITLCGDIVLPERLAGHDADGDSTDPDIHDIFNTVQKARAQGMNFVRAKENVNARKYTFMEAVYARNLRVGLINLMSLSGLGGLRPNTVVVGYKREWPSILDRRIVKEYEVMMTDVLFHNYGLVVVRDDAQVLGGSMTMPFEEMLRAADASKMESPPRPLREGERPLIDVWWLVDDGGLTLLLPHLLRTHEQFKNYDLRVVTVGDWSDPHATRIIRKSEETMVHALSMFRIKADVVCVQAKPTDPPSQESIDHFMEVYPECTAFLPESNWSGPFPTKASVSRTSDGTAVSSRTSDGAVVSADDVTVSTAASGGRSEPRDGVAEPGDGVFSGRVDGEEKDVEAGASAGAGAAAASGGHAPPVRRPSDGSASPGSPLRRAHSKSSSGQLNAVFDDAGLVTTRRIVRFGEIIREYTHRLSDRKTDMVFITLPLPQPGCPPGMYLSWLESLSRGLPPTVMMRGNNADVLTFYS